MILCTPGTQDNDDAFQLSIFMFSTVLVIKTSVTGVQEESLGGSVPSSERNG